MIDIKICGITNYKDAMHAKTAGASAIGMIFYNKSPRFIDIENAKKICINVPRMKKIGIFVNEKKDIINDIVNELNLDAIQLHGDESPEFCNNFKVPVIKALSVSKKSDLSVVNNYEVHAVLLDNKINDQFGGTGKIFNWKMIENVKFNLPIILSGGLNEKNILDGISQINPHAVDINSGVEKSPGLKSKSKIFRIVKLLKQTKKKEFSFG
jgi:phosphoribosylanthranilate isomerase